MSPVPPTTSPSGDAHAALNRAIFMRESQQAARALEEVLAAEPGHCLAVQHQFELARLLELGNEPRLALAAYESLMTHHPDTAQFHRALRSAGHLSYRLKQYKKCRDYLEQFLHAGGPTSAERMDAEGLLSRLPDGKGLRDPEDYECVRSIAAGPAHDSAIQIDGAHRADAAQVPESASQQPTWYDPQSAENAREGLSSEILARGVKTPEPEEHAEPEDDVQALLFGSVAETIPPPAIKVRHPTEGDEAWDEAADTPPVSLSSRDLRSSAYQKHLVDADDGMVYGLILPQGTRMSVQSVVEAVRIIDGSLTEEQARERMIECKGLLKGGMTRSAAKKLHDRLAAIDHKLVFRAVERDALPAEPTMVRRAELLEPGLRLHTDLGVRKVKWNMVRLVNCGRVDQSPFIDLFCEVSLVHYRLSVPGLSFAEMAEDRGLGENEAARRVLATLRQHGDPDTIWSRPTLSLLDGELHKPQKFGSQAEVDRYNRCLLLTHFGLEVQFDH